MTEGSVIIGDDESDDVPYGFIQLDREDIPYGGLAVTGESVFAEYAAWAGGALLLLLGVVLMNKAHKKRGTKI